MQIIKSNREENPLPHQNRVIGRFDSIPHLEHIGDGFILGGAALANFAIEYDPIPGITYGDVDVFFRTEEDYKAVLNSAYFLNPLIIRVETKYSTTLTMPNGLNIQLVKWTFGTPEEQLARFDIVNCMFGYLPKTKTILWTKEAVRAIRNNEIELADMEVDEEQITSTLDRVKKYHARYDWLPSYTSIQIMKRWFTKHPDLCLSKKQIHRSSVWSVRAGTNIWSQIRPILEETGYLTDNDFIVSTKLRTFDFSLLA